MPLRKQHLTEAKSVTNPEERICYVLWQTQHATERVLSDALKELGFSLSLFRVLKHIEVTPKLTGAELARRLDVTPQSVSSAVAQARKLGWIKSSSHSVHRSLVELELTPAGTKILGRVMQRVMSVEQRLTAAMTGDERTVFLQLLRRVRATARGW